MCSHMALGNHDEKGLNSFLYFLKAFEQIILIICSFWQCSTCTEVLYIFLMRQKQSLDELHKSLINTL